MVTRVDTDSQLVYAVKRPAEDKTYTIDFKNVLPSGVTLASVSAPVVTAAGLVTEDDALTADDEAVSGTKVSVKIGGGTDDENYEVTLTCVDSNGDTVSDDVMIKVRKAGLV